MEISKIKKHTSMGLASLLLVIISILLIVIIVVLLFINIGSEIFFILYVFSILLFIILIIAIIFGAFAYFGKEKDVYGLIGFILGIIIIATMPITMSATTYLYVSGIVGNGLEAESLPYISFDKDNKNATLTLVTIYWDEQLKWSEYEIKGNCNKSALGIYLTVGDVISECSGMIEIRHIESNYYIGSSYLFN